MGAAASLHAAGARLDDVLTQAEVQRLAGDQYRENVFLEIADDNLTVTRRQFERCAALAERNLLRYVAVGSSHVGDGNSGERRSRAARKPPEEWAAEVAAHREAGNLLEAAVTAQRVFMAYPTAERCLDWMRALHAHGARPGRLVNLAEGYCAIYPDSTPLAEFLTNARKKVAQPFEEIEDQLYVLTEEERQRVDDEVDALQLDVTRDAADLSYFSCCEVARRARVRIVDDVVAYLKDQVLCTYVGKMTQQTIFWTRRDSNMPGIEREDQLLRRYAMPLVALLQQLYPQGRKWFEKDYAGIELDLREFRVELMNAKLVFALWDSVRSGIRFHDAVARGEPPPASATVTDVPRAALVQVYCFLEVVGQHLFSKMKDWKDHERFRLDWRDKHSLARFMRAKYQAMAEDKNKLADRGHTVPTAGGGEFAEVLLTRHTATAMDADPATSRASATATASTAQTQRSTARASTAASTSSSEPEGQRGGGASVASAAVAGKSGNAAGSQRP